VRRLARINADREPENDFRPRQNIRFRLSQNIRPARTPGP
jgi:hypothetical protein